MDSGLTSEGLQPERTELAWRRTLLSFAVLGVLSIRYIDLPPLLTVWLTVGTILLFTLGTYLTSILSRIRADEESSKLAASLSGWVALIVVLMTLMLAITAAFWILLEATL
jgi:uncharacterized membrane protein YidH (DUF202 family)